MFRVVGQGDPSNGKGGGDDLVDPLERHESPLEVLQVVDVGEGNARDWLAQELAQRLPALFDLEDQQPVGRDDPLDLLDVGLEDLDAVFPVLEVLVASKHGPAPAAVQALGDVLPVGGVLKEPGVEDDLLGGEDGPLAALVPLLRVADGQHDLGVGVETHQQLVMVAGGEVRGGGVAPQHMVDGADVEGFPPAERGPHLVVPAAAVIQGLLHVVALEPENFKGALEGEGPCATVAGPDNFKVSHFWCCCRRTQKEEVEQEFFFLECF